MPAVDPGGGGQRPRALSVDLERLFVDTAINSISANPPDLSLSNKLWCIIDLRESSLVFLSLVTPADSCRALLFHALVGVAGDGSHEDGRGYHPSGIRRVAGTGHVAAVQATDIRGQDLCTR